MVLIALSAVPAKLVSDALAYRIEQHGLAGLRGLDSNFLVEGPITSFL
jgi:hypothetical protein